MSSRRKVAFITGASSGIGEALAREFAGRGYDLVLLARRTDRLAALSKELTQGEARAISVGADVTKDGDLERAVEVALKEFGAIDLTVANAGFSVDGDFCKLSTEDYRRQFETNVFGVLRAIYATLPELKKNKGSIAVVGSIAGYVSIPGNTAYSMSKAALLGLCEGLSAELAADGVSVTHIQPGFIGTEIFQVDRQGQWHDKPRDPPPKWLIMPVKKAASQIANSIQARRPQVIITLHGKVIVGLQRFLPWAVRFAMKKTVLAPTK